MKLIAKTPVYRISNRLAESIVSRLRIAKDGCLRSFFLLAALTAGALGLQSAGIVGAVVGLGAGYWIASGMLVKYRFIRR